MSEPFRPCGRGELPLETVHLTLGGPVLDRLAQHTYLYTESCEFRDSQNGPPAPSLPPCFLTYLGIESNNELGRQSGGAASPHGVDEVDRIKGLSSVHQFLTSFAHATHTHTHTHTRIDLNVK